MKFVQKLPLLNLAASGAPTVDDDVTKGYSIGSEWKSSVGSYRCTDATSGAAVWISTSGGGSEIFDSGDLAALADNDNWDNPAWPHTDLTTVDRYYGIFTGTSLGLSAGDWAIVIDDNTGAIYECIAKSTSLIIRLRLG